MTLGTSGHDAVHTDPVFHENPEILWGESSAQLGPQPLHLLLAWFPASNSFML